MDRELNQRHNCFSVSVLDDMLNTEIEDRQIAVGSSICQRSLKERAAAYGGQLNLSDEMPREEPVGGEVW